MNKYLITTVSVLGTLVIGIALAQSLVNPTGQAESAISTFNIAAKQANIIPVRRNKCHNCYQLSIDKGIIANKNRTNKTTENTTIDDGANNHTKILPNYTKSNATLIKGIQVIPINLMKVQVSNEKINYYFNTMPGSPNPLPLCGNIPGMSKYKTCSKIFNVKINVVCNSSNHNLCREMTNPN